MLMTPGLAFFYGGLVGRKNVLTIMIQSFVSMSVTTVLWVVCGYSMAFSGSYGDPANPDIGGIIGNFHMAFLHGVDPTTPFPGSPTIPLIVFIAYQMMFAQITPALITGAFANRVTFKAYLMFLVAWLLLVYFPVAHMVWGGGLLQQHGVLDFAGGIVVHATAGFAALAAVFYVGKRRVADAGLHSIPLVALGTGLLWFGWYGFNAGSELKVDPITATAFLNTDIAASFAAMTWLVLAWTIEKKPKFVGTADGLDRGAGGRHSRRGVHHDRHGCPHRDRVERHLLLRHLVQEPATLGRRARRLGGSRRWRRGGRHRARHFCDQGRQSRRRGRAAQGWHRLLHEGNRRGDRRRRVCVRVYLRNAQGDQRAHHREGHRSRGRGRTRSVPARRAGVHLMRCPFRFLLLAGVGACAVFPPTTAPVVADRPGYTDGPSALPAGALDIEVGATSDHVPDATYTSIGELLIRAGIGARTELRFFGNSYGIRSSPGVASSHGLEDIKLGFKVALHTVPDSVHGLVPRVAFLAATTLPTGADGFSAGKALPEAKFAAAWTTSGPFSLYTNLGVGEVYDGTATGSHGWGSAALWFAASPKVSLYGEGLLIGRVGGVATSAKYVDGGIAYLLTSQLQADFRFGHGIGDNASKERFFGAGLAWRR